MKKINKILIGLSSAVCSAGIIAPALASCSCSLIHVKEGSEFSLIKSSKGYCIDGLKTEERDKVTEIVVPSQINGTPVVEISKGAFKGCSNLESITLPFIGHSEAAVANAALFGYVFGDEIYEGCTAFTWQNYSTNDSYDALPTEGCGFALPSTLRHITITGNVKIAPGAFSGCLYIKDINFTNANATIDEIGNYAFYECKSLKSFTIPSTVKTIGRCAFSGCRRLKEIVIPANTTTVKHNAFSNCKSVYKAYVPSTVTDMGKLVFENFNGLLLCESKSVPSTWDSEWVSKNSSVVYDYQGGGFVYTKDMIVAICGKDDNKYASVIQLLGEWDKENVEIPGTVTSGDKTYTIKQLGASLFLDCTKVVNVTIGENIESLGPNCFDGCTNLTKINFPDSLKTIGSYCFKGCHSLSKHDEVVEGVTTEVNGLNFKHVQEIGPSAFEDLLGLKQINLGDSMVTIEDAAFKNCIYLNPLRLTDGTKRPLIFPKTIKTIGAEAFYNISKLKETEQTEEGEVTISLAEGDITFEAGNVNEEVTIGESAFELAGVRSTTPGVYPSNIYFHLNLNNIPVKKFNNNVFKSCYLHSLLNFPQNITEIGNYAFYDCIPTYLKEDTSASDCKLFQIPKSVKTIGNYAFYDCYNCGFKFEGAKTNESQLETIGKAAFGYCSYNPTNESDDRTGGAYKEIYIPDSVTSVGESAFVGNNGARTIHISTNEKMTRLEGSTFNSCINLGAYQTDDHVVLNDDHYEYDNPIEVPSNITYLSWNVFCSCSLLKAITIHGDVTTVGSSLFANCISLENGKVWQDSKRLSSIIFDHNLESVTSFGSSIYQGCSKLVWAPFQTEAASVKSPYSSIPSYAFAECDSLTDFNILGAITVINNAAFRRCKGMEKVTGMSAVKYIYQNAFMDCKGLKYFAMPSGCHTIGDNAFANCVNLGLNTYSTDQQFVLPTDITQAWSSSSNIGMGLSPFVGWGSNQNIYFQDANILSEDATTKQITLKWGWVLIPDSTTSPTYYTCDDSGSSTVHFVKK